MKTISAQIKVIHTCSQPGRKVAEVSDPLNIAGGTNMQLLNQVTVPQTAGQPCHFFSLIPILPVLYY